MAAISQKQLARWYEAHGTELMLYARQWSPDQQAEDIVQDAFIKLLKQRTCPDNVRAWLFRVVRNTSISTVRRLRRQRAGQDSLNRQNLWFESRCDDLIDARL
ncbi:MAG: RNA polymerase sigma factor, partial [Planctomycetota bacterium]